MKLSPTSTRTLETYRRLLPSREHQALSAWLSTFYPFQADWLLDPSELAICNKSRQIGLSHTTSAVGTVWGAFHGELTTIISVGERESVEVLEKAKKHAGVLVKLGSRMAQVGKKDNANELTFASGGRILALPSSGGRSFTGNVFLDEFAYQEQAKKVWDAAAAVTLLGKSKLRIASTPNGVGNDFHTTWKTAMAPKSGWSAHEIPIETAISQGFPVDLDKCWKLAKGDPRVFDQLFRCSFLDNEFQYIPDALLEAATTDQAIPRIGQCWAGLDVGRTANLTALTILREVDGVLWLLLVETKRRTSLEDLEALVYLALETHGAYRICIDATGMGAFPAEALQRRFGRLRVEPVTFTTQVKEDLATTLYQRFAEGRIRLRRTDSEVRDDVRAIRRVVTTAGNVRYDAPNTDEGHADRAWALALAVHAAANRPAERHEVLDHNEPDDDLD